MMEKYGEFTELGSGSFGVVFSARHKQTGELVAIKMLKDRCSLEECMALPEIQYSCSNLKHPNMVQVREWFIEYRTVFIVFEYMQNNLSQLMNKNRETKFTEPQIRNFCRHILLGLDYMHTNGYFHRDLKPDNLLVNPGVIKIGDLGSARGIGSGPFTDYVTTRWYRAPEVLLGSSFYDSKIDMWAAGVILAELFNLRPLFPGVNAHNQMQKICSIIGTPTMDMEYSWSEAWHTKYGFPQFRGIGLSSAIPSASEPAIQLIASLLSWDPLKRPTAAEALQHPFFVGSYRIPRAFPHATPQRHSRILPATLDSSIFV